MPDISELSFEKTIERGPLRYGPDAFAGEMVGVRETAPPYEYFLPGGYRKRPERPGKPETQPRKRRRIHQNPVSWSIRLGLDVILRSMSN